LKAFARHFDQKKLGLYLMKKLYLSADERTLLELARLCIDAAVYPRLLSERFGTEEIRAQAFEERLRDALDEISGLDPVIRDDILDMLLGFVQDEEHSIPVSSHITSDLEKIADYIVFIMKEGLCFLSRKTN